MKASKKYLSLNFPKSNLCTFPSNATAYDLAKSSEIPKPYA